MAFPAKPKEFCFKIIIIKEGRNMSSRKKMKSVNHLSDLEWQKITN